ncbi:NACHT domain-containing protein [Nocardia sp. ET3-3]|uniref:NACHT domain-containing protein n=1 Tax=Nocardia terrae TaxID=2675851 RepID=A0A7K1VBA8_9NOCA|nr:NACHT domain-containing protein [Nocardia terrae]MVU83759.1 NACHT domain-containing protein [Nocardia terrae]
MANDGTETSRLQWLQKYWKPAVAASGLLDLYFTWLRDFAHAHMIIAGVLLIVYWLGLATTAFLWQAARPAAEEARQRVSDRVGLGAGNTLSRYDRRYRAYMLRRMHQIGSTGAVDLESSLPVFDDVYVEVDLTRASPGTVPSDALATGQFRRTNRLRVADLLCVDAPRILVALGAAGIGKTTLAIHIVRDLAYGNLDRRRAFTYSRSKPFLRRNHRRTVPILITLAHQVPLITGPVVPPLEELATVDLSDAQGCRRWLRAQLRAGRCVIVVDGFDEVPDIESRLATLKWIAASPHWSEQGNHFVITSRPDSYRDTPINDCNASPGTGIPIPVFVVQVRRLTKPQVELFVRRRFEAMSLGRSTVHAEPLLRQLEAPALAALTVNPLLLTMMITLYWHLLDGPVEPRLPEKRVDLYRGICHLLITRRPVAQFDADQKLRALHTLAYTMMDRQVTQLSRTEAAQALGLADPDPAFAALKIDGLLVIAENQGITFTHKTFQEYLAAVHMQVNELVEVIVEHIGDAGDWWRETILFYAGLTSLHCDRSIDPVIEECLHRPYNPAAIAMALALREQGGSIAPGLISRLDALVDEATAVNTDEEVRRAVARALLTHHLNRPVAQPITARIYRMFMLDERSAGRLALPPDVHLPEDLDKPVFGARGDDTVRLVAWANALLATSSYRLPTEYEVVDLVDRDAVPGCRPEVRTTWIHTDVGLAAWYQSDRKTYVRHQPTTAPLDALAGFLNRVDGPEISASTTDSAVRQALTTYPAFRLIAAVDCELAVQAAARIHELAALVPAARGRMKGQFLELLAVAVAAHPNLFEDIDDDQFADLEWTGYFETLTSGRDSPYRALAQRLLGATDGRPGSTIFLGKIPQSPLLGIQERLPLDMELEIAAAVAAEREYPAATRARALVLLRLFVANDSSTLDRRQPENFLSHLQSDQFTSLLANPLCAPEWGRPHQKWTRRMADELFAYALPVLRRERRPTADELARATDMALYLASNLTDQLWLTGVLMDIASLLTALQDRFDDSAYPEQTIILVHDD